MKFTVSQTSGNSQPSEVEFTTLQELIEWVRRLNYAVIVLVNDDSCELEIYDCERE